jgi:hypothetical protein
LALAVKELWRNKLPLAILHCDEPTLLAIKSIMDNWGLWGMLIH